MAFSAYHVAFLAAVTFFIFRFGTELVVYGQIRFQQQCYCVVDSGTAHSELLLVLHVIKQFLNIEAPVYGIYGLKDCISLRSASASVLFKVVREYLSDGLRYSAVFHRLHSAAKRQ